MAAFPGRLPPSRLEQILSARAGMRLQQFGYDQLGSGRPVTVPETGAVQDDYIMGPGDEVVVSLRGQENSDIRTTVDRDGRVILPRLAPIPASGRSFGSFRQDVDALVRRAYVPRTASVSIGRVRQISVLVSGEVNVPGQRIATGLSSAVDAILLSGGIKKSGSLRNIRIQRGGHDYVVDLYSVLTGSGNGGGMRLADGDRVIVPPLGATIAVAGLVRRPGIYELPAHASAMTARALLNLAGGQEVRGRYRLAVQRIEADGRLNLVPLQGETGVVRDSEILRVELGADLAGSQATLSGGIGLAGQYAVTTGTRLSDVIRAPGALGNSPYTLFGIIVRKDPRTLMRSLMAFTPVAVLNGTEDLQLQTDDVIRPLSVGETQMLSFVLKTYLDKLSLDQARIRNPLGNNNTNAAQSRRRHDNGNDWYQRRRWQHSHSPDRKQRCDDFAQQSLRPAARCSGKLFIGTGGFQQRSRRYSAQQYYRAAERCRAGHACWHNSARWPINRRWHRGVLPTRHPPRRRRRSRPRC